jgi:cytochrome c556
MRLLEGAARRGATAIIGAIIVGASTLPFAVRLHAQSNDDFLPQITIVEIMDSMVMPAAQVVWDAVAYEVTAQGETITGPKTDEDWQKVRWSAITLAESANNLAIPGRAVNHPGAVAAEGELAPEKIQELIDKDRAAWVAHAHVLYEAAMQAVRAIDARNPEQVSEAGGTIDSACESCHLQFWYPDQ